MSQPPPSTLLPNYNTLLFTNVNVIRRYVIGAVEFIFVVMDHQVGKICPCT